jgi:hypothetical protein
MNISADLAQAGPSNASTLQIIGALCFGLIVGWYVYYINRYRTGKVQFSDLVTVIGIIGGGAVLALFKAETDLFGAYGIGLAIGFFSYFVVLLILVQASANFDWDWFLDGRRIRPGDNYWIPEGIMETVTVMDKKLDASSSGAGQDTNVTGPKST